MPTTFPFEFGSSLGGKAPPVSDYDRLEATGLHAPSLEFTSWLGGVFPEAIGANGKPDQLSGPVQTFRYIKQRRDVITQSAQQRPLLRLADKNMNIVADLEGERSASVEEVVHDSGTANVAIRFDNWLTDYLIHQTKVHEDLHLLVDPFPTEQDWRTRWGGKITGINAKKDAGGIHTVELEAISNREHAKHLLFGANPFFPPEVQLPKMWVLPGNTRTILALSMAINLARIFSPLLSIPTNLFNPAGWINPLGVDAIANLNPLSWPLQMAYVDAALDQSRTSVLGATWTDWHSTMADMLRDAGVVFRAYTYLTTDKDSPHTELVRAASLLGPEVAKNVDQLARPTRNAVVFALEDKSGRNGPTGTALDGLLNLAAVTLDDLISPIVVNIDKGETLNGQPLVEATGIERTTLIERLTGVAKKPPKCIWWEGDYTGIIETNLNMHKGPTKTIWTGGRSPTIVNQAQTFAIRYALSQLAQVINYGLGAYQQPLTEGLDNLYQGQLDNVLLAWQKYTDPQRALFSGDMAWQEHIERGSGTAYTLAGVLTIRVGHYKTRAWTGFQCKVINGRPHVVDRDIRLGERGGFEFDQIIYVDQLTAIKREWSRDKPVTTGLAIGDDRESEDPTARGMRVMAAIWSTLGQFLGEGTLFG